jgi:ribose transport system permease protein
MLGRRPVAVESSEARAKPLAAVGLVQRILGFRELLLIGVIVLAALLMSRLTPYFLTWGNIESVIIGMAPTAIIVVGMTVVLVSGGLDLSVGSVMALSGTVVGLLLLRGVPIWLSVLLVLATGAVVGFINGVVITKLRVNPLITTLGMLTIARGIAMVITQGFTVTGLPAPFAYLGQGSLLGVPPMLWVMALIVAAGDVAMRSTRYMRQVYYVGGNERAALLSGIKVDRVKTATYVLSALLSTVAGILLASRLMAGTPTAGVGLELTAIAAAVIGGASLMGGEGTVLGGFLGTVFMSLIGNAMIILGISIYWQGIVSGVILILVVSLDMLLRARYR